MATLQLTVPGMNCSACAEKILKAVQSVDPAATVQTDPVTKRVHVDTIATDITVKQAIVSAGYAVT